jgi:uncharacterized repeat protein (TIGR03803 family)
MLGLFDTAHAGFTVLHSFAGGSDGANPQGSLTKDTAGNLYGTTSQGGGTGCSGYGCGTVFKLAPDDIETVLYAFTGGSDGANPGGRLSKDTAGNLYGITGSGGVIADCGGYGCGTVFRLAPDGTETVLHAFTGGSDGAYPGGRLIWDAAGNLYGTTFEGGNTDCRCGIVFELAPDGTETVLHAFTDMHGDGAYPEAGVIMDSAGNLYGTTALGGIRTGGGGGTVFELATDGSKKVLHVFHPKTGWMPGALIMDSDGNFYGTTFYGGRAGCYHDSGCGTVFELAPDGTETVLHIFTGGSDGAHSSSALIRYNAGNLYGTTQSGGGGCPTPVSGCGTVFEVAPDGTETVLYTFTGGGDGAHPVAGLIKDDAGNLYGTTSDAGSTNCRNGCGTIFKLQK